MCMFGNQSKIISEQDLTLEQALVGYRCWYINNSFNKEEKRLRSTNQNFLWPIGEVIGNALRDNSEGIYNYNNCNYYNNYNNYNNCNYYYSNYNYNYSICGKTLLYGKIFSYEEGYRSSICIPTHLAILSDKKWSDDIKTKNFVVHFNTIVIDLAKDYNCKTIGYDELSKK